MKKIALVYTLVSSHAEARDLAKDIIQKRYAGCVNIFPCQSIYEWDHQIQETDEWALLIKTSSAKSKIIFSYLTEKHPYQIPCILCSDQVSALEPFAHWIDQKARDEREK